MHNGICPSIWLTRLSNRATQMLSCAYRFAQMRWLSTDISDPCFFLYGHFIFNQGMQNQVKTVMKPVMTQLSNSICCDYTQMITSICWEYTHTKQHFYMALAWLLRGRHFFFLWDLPKQTQNGLVSALPSFAQVTFTIHITKSCTHSIGRGRRPPKHAQVVPCYHSPISSTNQTSDHLQMPDKPCLETRLSVFESWRLAW